MVRSRTITASTKHCVLLPSKKPVRRVGENSSELPINRLLADPTTAIVGPKAEQISRLASSEATAKILVDIENLLDRGKAY